MASFSTPTTYAGTFKRVYADKLANLLRTDLYLTKSTKFKAEKRLGDSYEQPVVLSHEHGFTFGGSAGNAYALNEAISGETGNARVKGFEMTLKGLISRATLERAMSSEAAFIKGTQPKVKAMMDAHAKELEWNLMYGGSATGFGTIASISGTSTTRALVISAATWSANRWQGMKNALIDIYESTTKRVGTVDCSVVSVDLSTRTVNISGDATELTALDSAVSGSDTYILRKGEYGNVAIGLDKIATTSSGNLFELDTANELWKASTYSAGSANLSMEKILEAVDQSFERGGEGDVSVLIPSKAFIDLAMDEVALKRHGVGKEVENGFAKLAFHSQCGTAKVAVGKLLKDGEAFVFPNSILSRVGAYGEIKFEDAIGGEVFWPVSGYNGYEMRSYSDQALFCDAPGQIVKITNITN